MNRVFARVLVSRDYEDRFQELMLGSIHPGDCVWDIGANVGLYARRFAELVGERGCVFAFEPSPVNVEELRRAVRDRSNVVVLPIALGDCEGMVKFQQGADALGATSKIVDAEESAAREFIEVAMMRGDELVRSDRARMPNVIKIDTEGFELEVLEGLSGVIGNSALRTLCIEVHFGLLKARGMGDAPSRIERWLDTTGFRHAWPDASHIVATRSTA